MAELLCDGVAVTTMEVADTSWTRLKGLLGRKSIDGAMLITKSSSVHSVGMKFAIDVAYCNKSLVVTDVAYMKPMRVGRPRRGAKSVLEASAGAFERWNIKVGSQLAIKP